MRVAVVGAGAVGVTAAHALAEGDAETEVTLFEAGEVAAGSSGRAAGICYDAFADRVDAELGERSLERFRDLSGTGEFTFTDCPYVWLARAGDERHARAIREGVERMQDHDRAVSLLTPDAFAERFSTLESDVELAAVAERAGYADPATYTRVVAGLAEGAGVDVRTYTPVRVRAGPHVEAPEGTEPFDAVLVAAGAHTKRVVEPLASLPVKPYRVQALTTPTGPETPMLYDATEGYYLRPHGEGLLVGDGTEPIERDPNDWDREADDWFVEACAGYEERAFGPGESLPVERAWAGLCTATPDGHPLAGPLPGHEGVYVATGWQGHGFMRSPAMGERLAAQVLGGEGIPAFDPDRFDGDEEFDIVEGMAVEERLPEGA